MLSAFKPVLHIFINFIILTLESKENFSFFTLPEKLTSINGYAFESDTSLTDIKLPNSLTLIDEDAFANSGLLSIDIPGSVTEIGSKAFTGVPLKGINLNEGLQKISNMAFYLNSEAKNTINEITIPDSVTTIGNSI